VADEHAALGAFTALDPGRALRLADRADREPGPGPLHGVPVVVKDNIHVAGLPHTAGTPALADFVPAADAPVVRALVGAGAFVLGKTAMHELSFGATSASSASGPVRNVHRPACFAGGSSGGTAVAVALGVPAGLGTDTGGSIRIPAALNGVCGFRPTPGRYPGEGITPLSATRDVPGPVARTVTDLALLDAVLSGDDRGLPGMSPAELRLGVPGPFFTEPLGAETREAHELALERLRACGVTLVDVPALDPHGVEDEVGFPIVLHEARHELTAYLAEHHPSLGLAELAARAHTPSVRQALLEVVVPGAVTVESYRQALAGRDRLRETYRRAFAEHRLHALVFPTTPRVAGEVGPDDELIDLAGTRGPTFGTFIRNTGPGSIAGLPGVTVPVPRPGPALPVGLALDGWSGTDRVVLAAGVVVERLLAGLA
jgi:mandelamide amidase